MWDNPMGTDGFEFIEYAAPDPQAMGELFERMGFKAVAKHRHKASRCTARAASTSSSTPSPTASPSASPACTAPASAPSRFACRTPRRPTSAPWTLGAWGYAGKAGPGELNIPAIKGIGDSIIYLVDRWRGKNGAKDGDIGNIGFFDVDFEPCRVARQRR
jgi:4-hydroxyphenylpyruvate dioxygenase